MTLKVNSFIGIDSGTGVTTSNSGGTSGTAFDATVISSGCSVTCNTSADLAASTVETVAAVDQPTVSTQDSWGFEVHINATGTAAGVEDYYAETYGDLAVGIQTTPGQVTGGTRLTTALAGTSAAARMAGNATTSDTVAGSAASEGTLTGSTTATTITGG